MQSAITITPETLAVIAASITAFLGKKVRNSVRQDDSDALCGRALGTARPLDGPNIA